jgi:hypothetical protein
MLLFIFLMLLAPAVVGACCCWPLLLLASAGVPAVPGGNCCFTSRTKFMDPGVFIQHRKISDIYSIFNISHLPSFQIFCDRFFKLLPKSATINEALQFSI